MSRGSRGWRYCGCCRAGCSSQSRLKRQGYGRGVSSRIVKLDWCCQLVVIEAEIVVPLETRDPHLMECGIEHWTEERGEVTMEMKA